jgi:hypothetical protein
VKSLIQLVNRQRSIRSQLYEPVIDNRSIQPTTSFARAIACSAPRPLGPGRIRFIGART